MTRNEDTGSVNPQNNGGAHGEGKQPPQYRRSDDDQPTQQFGPFVPPPGAQPSHQQSRQPQQPPHQQGQSQTSQSQHPWDRQDQYYPNTNAGYAQGPSSKKSGSGIVVFILLAIIVVLGIFGFITYQTFISNNDSSDQTQTAQGSSTGSESTESAESAGATDSANGSSGTSSSASEEPSTSTTPAEKSRPERPDLPAGAIAANAAARAGEPAGDFNQVWRGTEITSEPFARSVRDAFVRHYLDTDETSGTVSAYSSVTGQTYTMNCMDNRQFVTCTGGNNAVVYIA